MAEPAPPRTRLPIGRILAGLAAVVAVVLVGRQIGGQVAASIVQFAEWVHGLGAWGPVVFIVSYAIAVAAFVPASLLTFAAGTVFGLRQGVAYVFAAAVLGSSIAFLLGRYAARGAIERRLAGNAGFAAIDRAVSREGRKIVFLLRLSPFFPFVLLNYGLGLTSVRFLDYLLASVGMIPGTFLYVYSGSLVTEFSGLASGAAVEKGPGYYVLLVLGIVATVAVTVFVTRVARRALEEATRR